MFRLPFKLRRRLFALALIAALLSFPAGIARSEGQLPQIDSSTARIPITDAVYRHFANLGYAGPEPMCSKTHGAWMNLASGDADLVLLIAPTADELRAFRQAGVDIEMKVYGCDGLVFLGNASNPVENLTGAEIRSIYRGDLVNWLSCENGEDADIEVYIRNPESGSQRLFENLVWDGYEMPDFESLGFETSEVSAAQPYRIEVSDEMGDITYSVMQARYSIGFNIFSYIDMSFLSRGGQEKTVVTTGNVNLRSEPSRGGDIVGTVPEGTVLKYMGDTVFDERPVAWYRVTWNADDWAWVSSMYSRLDEDNASLKLFRVDGAAPGTETFADGSYPYVTTAYVAIRASEPGGSPARALFDWFGTDESREIIQANSSLSVAFSDPVVIRARESDGQRIADLISQLDARTILPSEMQALTQWEAEMAYLSLYAHAGAHFSQPDVRAFFESAPWYQDQGYNDSDARLYFTEIALQNGEALEAYLKLLWRARAGVQPRQLDLVAGEAEMTGEDVRNTGQALIDAGFLNSDADLNSYDWRMRAAVEAFQRENGLNPTGRLDPFTRLALLGPADGEA